MAYVRGQRQTSATVLTVEQARSRNAELRREIAALIQENGHLEAQIATTRFQVTAARRRLTRLSRQLEAARAQAERLGKVTISPDPLSEPVYGGREGLEAAAAEMEAYEAKDLKLSKRRERKGPSHGTGRRYAVGCRCGDCMGWRERKSTQSLAGYHARKRAA